MKTSSSSSSSCDIRGMRLATARPGPAAACVALVGLGRDEESPSSAAQSTSSAILRLCRSEPGSRMLSSSGTCKTCKCSYAVENGNGKESPRRQCSPSSSLPYTYRLTNWAGTRRRSILYAGAARERAGSRPIRSFQ